MQGTIHLVSAEDCLALRALMQPVLDAELSLLAYAPLLAGVDLAPVMRAARGALAERATRGSCRAIMREGFPEHDATPPRLRLPVPPATRTGPAARRASAARVTLATAESWLGRAPPPEPSIDDAVLRYLAAFGPAAPADAAAWSRLPNMRADPGAPAPAAADLPGRARGASSSSTCPTRRGHDPGTPAPVHFLGYDNVLLSHADRSRVVANAARARLSAAAGIRVRLGAGGRHRARAVAPRGRPRLGGGDAGRHAAGVEAGARLVAAEAGGSCVWSRPARWAARCVSWPRHEPRAMMPAWSRRRRPPLGPRGRRPGVPRRPHRRPAAGARRGRGT